MNATVIPSMEFPAASVVAASSAASAVSSVAASSVAAVSVVAAASLLDPQPASPITMVAANKTAKAFLFINLSSFF